MQGGVGLFIECSWLLKRVVVCEFALVTLAFFLEDLEAAHLLGSYVAPGNTEVGRVKLKFEDPLEEATGDRVGAHVIQVVQTAMRAAVDGVLPGAAVRAGARRVGIPNGALVPALPARHIVGIRAATRAVRAPVAQVVLVDGPMDQKPERDRMRPLIRP